MTNDVANRQSTEVDPFEELGNEAQQRIHGNLLRFTKHGQYKTGQEQEIIEDNTRMLAYLPGLERGWIKWQDNAPAQYVMGLVRERFQPPTREALGDLDQSEWSELGGRKMDPWQYTYHLVMLDETGQLHTFVTSSKGGKDAVLKLSGIYGAHKKMKPDEIPIIELSATSYQHPEFGETFKPILKVSGWAKIPQDFEELNNTMKDEADASQEPFLIEAKTIIPANKKTKPKAPPPPPPRGKGKNGPGKGVRF